ncbi:uncharacterized protein Dana_GF27418 [Drosophila ananassae]|uniref:Uncharacterized protein n=1 Tax=Drosophila ananassae TaxID=7217 RepID=A0A0P9A631_DROAN|nr:uncharacterized protein Dana_GF27418 [Drosophila ananassae]
MITVKFSNQSNIQIEVGAITVDIVFHFHEPRLSKLPYYWKNSQTKSNHQLRWSRELKFEPKTNRTE